jgi:hypothetical protein
MRTLAFVLFSLLSLLLGSAEAAASSGEMARIHFGGAVSGQFAVSTTDQGFDGAVPNGFSGGLGVHLSFFQYSTFNARVAYDYFWLRLDQNGRSTEATLNLVQPSIGFSWPWMGIRHSIHAGMAVGSGRSQSELIGDLGSVRQSPVLGAFVEIREIVPVGESSHFLFGSKAYYLDWTSGGVHEFMFTLFVGLDFLSV